MAGKFELYKDKAGEYRWRLRHQNGNIIADSGEGYVAKANALNGIESVKKNSVEANINDMTPQAASQETATQPAAAPPPPAAKTEVAAPPPAARPAAAKFELYKDKAGEYRWRLRHQNGNIIADSGEGYVSKANALNGIESVKKNCVEANINDMPPQAAPQAPATQPAAAPPPPVAKTEAAAQAPAPKPAAPPPPAKPAPEARKEAAPPPAAVKGPVAPPAAVKVEPKAKPARRSGGNSTAMLVALIALLWLIMGVAVLIAAGLG